MRVLARAGHRAGVGTLAQDSRDRMVATAAAADIAFTVTQIAFAPPRGRWYVSGA